jgi:hypothetical protein
MTKKDLLTGEEFIPKRINQVFAKPANRIAYHNGKAADLRHSSSYLDKPLKTNLKILNALMSGSKEEIFHKQFLMGKGFSFEVYNNVQKMDGNLYYSIYSYAIIPMGKDQIKILKND